MPIKVLGRATPPLAEPLTDPKSGQMTVAWSMYFMRLPLTLDADTTRLDQLEASNAALEAEVEQLKGEVALLQAASRMLPAVAVGSCPPPSVQV